ncbi:hypothetical protein K3725_09725 [Leisingera sp. S132]|uniref:TipJ family phage tail tip protein n=1 Tax=Leisingera sp. S132 TaxID=2867016 RepID=UPI0021A3D767|nr:hypothetical protein [Leisingera sp. S132]UWQ77602.1 hypothetical protein K3725_09725 [Leisingera sp. S132]
MDAKLFETAVYQHPLKGRAQCRHMPEGVTVADLVQQAEIDPRLLMSVQVVISKGVHSTVVPVDKWHRVRPREGSHVLIGPKVQGPLAGAVLAAVLPSAASYIAGTTFALATTSFAYAAVYAAVTIVGSLLINALIPPPARPGSIQQDDPNFSITGSGNAEVKYGVYPSVLGRHKMFPPKTARGFTEGRGEEVYFRGRYTFGHGPVALEELKIGTTPIWEFSGVELEFLNVDSAETLSRIPQIAPLVKAWRSGAEALDLYPDDIAEDGYSVRLNQNDIVIRTTRERSTAAEIDVLYQGLVRFDENNNKQPLSRLTAFYYRKVGDSQFIDAGAELHTGATTANLRFTKLIVFPEPGEYEVQIKRIYEDSDHITVRDDSYLSAIRSIRTGKLPSHDGIAEVAVRIKASEQLNGQLEDLSVIVQQMAPVWDGASWTAFQPVRHPAWIYARSLMGPTLAKPLADSRIQLQDLLDWADQEPHWTCDAVIDQTTTVAEVLDMICGAGRARRTLRDLKYSIIRDGGAGPVVQQFSPRNSYDFRGAITFPKEIHGFRVRCLSERLDWQQDEITVYADGYDAATATELETLDLRGVVLSKDDANGGNAWRLGRYHLAQALLRYEEFTWKSDLDHLRVNMGDKVRFVHDVPMIGVGAGRVKSIVTDPGGNLVSFTLDELLTPEAGDYRVNWRSALGDEVVFSAAAPDSYDGIWTASEVVPAADLVAGDLVSIELMTQESVELLITAILHDGDLQATLKGVPAAPEVLDADQGEIPDYVPTITSVAPNSSLKPVAPRIISAVAQNVVKEDRSGARSAAAFAELEWQPGGAYSAERFVIYRISPEGDRVRITHTENTSGTYLLPEIGNYRFEIFGVNDAGRSDPAVVYVERTVSGETPAAVAGFVSRVAGDQLFLSWRLGEAIVSHYSLRYLAPGATGGWRQASLVEPEVSGSQIAIPAVNGRYLIKAVSLYGRESAVAAEVTVEGAGISALNVVELVQEHPGFAGAKTDGLSVVSDALMLLSGASIDNWTALDEVMSIGGHGGVEPTGTYDFAGVTDLGEVYTSRLSADVRGFGFRLDDSLANWSSLEDVEDLTGTSSDAWGIELQVSSTLNDPQDAGAVWDDWAALQIGDYSARAFRFRLQLISGAPEVAVQVDHVSVTIDMPDRVEAGADVQCPAGGVAVSFASPFRVRPAVTVDGQGLPTGARSVRSNVTREGFHQKFVDSAGADIACSFDWVAKGYGRSR